MLSPADGGFLIMTNGLGEAAARLTWLSPSASSLATLARVSPWEAWPEICHDPGALLLLVRYGWDSEATGKLKPFRKQFKDREVIQAALSHLSSNTNDHSGFVAWSDPLVQTLYQRAISVARLSHHLAVKTRQCDPDQAWLAGLLAPLGWLCVASVEPERTQDCFRQCQDARDSSLVQRERFGLETAAIARRLNQIWELPPWLATITGHLSLPRETLRELGGDEDLLLIVQLVLSLAERNNLGLYLRTSISPEEIQDHLNLDRSQIQQWFEEFYCFGQNLDFTWEDPHKQSLLPELLQLALQNRQLRSFSQVERLQQNVDVIQERFHDQLRREENHLRDRKLTALAEFAAGAAHEINNPLAVISGQAQYLLSLETEEEKQSKLQKIIGQTHRVHQILTDLMHFARPSEPKKQLLDVDALIREVALTLQPIASEKKVELRCPELKESINLYADHSQIFRTLLCLLQNGIEAAPEEGFAGISVELQDEEILFVVEDNGRGPNISDRDLIFDPFFSGRLAGRGRGLGLPTAWRLAQLHSGDVYWEPRESGPTRFVLKLPLNNLATVPVNPTSLNGKPLSASA